MGCKPGLSSSLERGISMLYNKERFVLDVTLVLNLFKPAKCLSGNKSPRDMSGDAGWGKRWT